MEGWKDLEGRVEEWKDQITSNLPRGNTPAKTLPRGNTPAKTLPILTGRSSLRPRRFLHVSVR